MHNSMTRYQAHRHPVAAVLTLLLFGPFLLAGALLVFVGYLLVQILTLGRKS